MFIEIDEVMFKAVHFSQILLKSEWSKFVSSGPAMFETWVMISSWILLEVVWFIKNKDESIPFVIKSTNSSQTP